MSAEDRQAFLDETAESLLNANDFVQEIQELVEADELTRPRWRIINAALQAHYDGQYLYSVPLLLSQLEGMFTDLLVAAQVVKREGRKVWVLDAQTGQVLLDKGKKVTVRGLSHIVTLSGYINSPVLGDFAGSF